MRTTTTDSTSACWRASIVEHPGHEGDRSRQGRRRLTALAGRVPTDILTLLITVVDTDAGWRVPGNDRA
jgi:hypothetical protein